MRKPQKPALALAAATTLLAFGGALAPSAMASTYPRHVAASPHDIGDCNNTTQPGDSFVQWFSSCKACADDATRRDSQPGGGTLYQYYCTYNPSNKHYDEHYIQFL